MDDKNLDDSTALLAKYLTNWYIEHPDEYNKFKKITQGKSDISLRLIDWLVTNYSRRIPIIYENKTGRKLNVHVNYKENLKYYGKRKFDPFQRGRADEQFEAELRQKNFFRWGLDNGVIDWLLKNRGVVEKDMHEHKTDKK